ncbi:hypothetical protein CDAR_538141 [Caerostris darwini]|uniref:Uncharacterized protein n=1 Tax=Caerostris darwini TaxID=1538125 RepID=A0AAV4UCL4_9ARAC|nr:hypothetical protein CDAR_538141 [Caerostris darwini]
MIHRCGLLSTAPGRNKSKDFLNIPFYPLSPWYTPHSHRSQDPILIEEHLEKSIGGCPLFKVQWSSVSPVFGMIGEVQRAE